MCFPSDSQVLCVSWLSWVPTDKKAAQKKLELMKKKVKKEKVNARKSREKLSLEIDKLKDELKVPAPPLLT